MKTNSQKICLVTGASSGIGKEIAIGLAKAGTQVIIVCRNKARGEEAHRDICSESNSQSVNLLIADLSSQTELRGLAKTIHNTYPRLDVLINNAGVVLSEKQFSADNIEMTLATNYLGPFLLTNLLLDLLNKSTSGRIINISSAIHKWAKMDLTDLQFMQRKYHFMKAYAQSKLLMNIMTAALAKKLRHSNTTINCIHPGAVKTHLGSNKDHSWIVKLADRVIKLFFISPRQAAESTINLALSSDFAGKSGYYFEKRKCTRLNYEEHIMDATWKTSEQLTQ